VNGNGRARRKELGWFIVFYLIIYFAAFFGASTNAANSGAASDAVNDGYILVALVYLAFLCPFTSLMSRRAHDFGQSGWMAALAPIPGIGALWALVFVCIPGQPGANQYGPDPKAGVA
jgi:uncharacterized membrane protein YhaH (DUF805 family)